MSNGNTYGVIIQARLSSTRLPNKVLLDISGKPMLQRQVERLREGIDGLPLIIATSDAPSDDILEKFCSRQGFACFRGPLKDVMLRFILCARKHGLTHIVRVGGDDVLIDPDCCTELVRLHQEEPADFLYASHREGWPYGSAAELIALDALERIHAVTDKDLYLEHTIPYFFDHPEAFRIRKVRSPQRLCRPELAFTVDFPEDLELIRAVFRELRDEGDFFPLERVIRLMDEKPEIRTINRHLHTGFDR
ncbi:MAG: glycosyltransferase family protein [Kiritimatiellae bacterium]|nr:glycosyltransferase family protein [Verrucomicrobiota bacterium]MCG2680940.1 glycosyltransferase family protein [Kiritimatiellia bacterium]